MVKKHVLVVGTAATLLLMPALPAAATTAQLPVDVWADFQKPAVWDNQADTLHFYVESPTVTKKMVGHTATTTLSTPATLDCASLVGGYQGADSWVTVPVSVESCTATQAVVSYTVTRDMVGQQASVIGWAATALSTADVTGSVSIGKVSGSLTVTAKRTDAVAPVGPLTSLGTWNGQQVSIASANGVNEVWVGNQRFMAPDGSVIHVGLTEGFVTIWYDNTTSVDRWRLSLADRSVTIESVASAKILLQGELGFVVEEPGVGSLMGWPDWTAYTWDGVARHEGSTLTTNFRGWTGDGLVVTGSYKLSYIKVLGMTGPDWAQDPRGVRGLSPVYRIVQILPDQVEYTVEYNYGDPFEKCTMTRTAVTCTPV